MKEKILIVEDEFIVAHDLQMVVKKDGYEVIGVADSVKQARAIIEVNKPDMVLLDIYLKGKLTGIDLAHDLMKAAIPFIYISANSNEKVLEAAKSTQPFGFIVKPYRNNDILLSLDIARYRAQHSANFKLSGELYVKGVIEGVVNSHSSREQKLIRVMSAFQPYIPFDLVTASGISKTTATPAVIGIARTNFDEYEAIPAQLFFDGAEWGYDKASEGTDPMPSDGIYAGDELDDLRKRFGSKDLIAAKFGLRSNLDKVISLPGGEILLLSFWSKIPGIYGHDHLDLLHHLSGAFSANFPDLFDGIQPDRPASVTANDQISFRKNDRVNFNGIIGGSTALLKVLDQIKIVANTDTSVLITGESGTGKELVAANLHRLSDRRNKPMITVNCAALPADLVESILFGHERGSFTGASEQRIGKFEEANGGTIFLDEIGEMPFELQSKLLRVLQEKEIERIGGKFPIPVDLRIIAATNRNLEKEISNGRFRIDLYYRLNVFPIHLPPLRERREDISVLANHFISRYAQKLKKNLLGFAPAMLKTLHAYDWPGNVRELEHLVERSVLLTSGGYIEDIYLDIDPGSPGEQETDTGVKTIAENEKEHIIAVLKKCNGKIAGEGGAAELLGIPPTTLNSKIKKLGITR